MKHFILKVCLFVGLVLLSLLVPYVYMSNYENFSTKTSMEMKLKYNIDKLKEIDTTKMVIIGGSGCGFGFKSDLLAKYYNIPVVNTGTHASIGLKLQVKLVEEYIYPDDIVLIIPEYQQFTFKVFYGIEDWTQYRILKNVYPEALKQRDIIQTLSTLKYIPAYYNEARNAQYEIDSLSPYSIYALNEYGDVCNWESRTHQDSLTGIGKMEERLCLSTFYFLCEKIKMFQDIGATVVLLPPTFACSAYYNNERFIEKIADRLQRRAIPFNVSPFRYCFNDTLFYDTSYHLTERGAFIRTNMVIQDLDSIWFNKNDTTKKL